MFIVSHSITLSTRAARCETHFVVSSQDGGDTKPSEDAGGDDDGEFGDFKSAAPQVSAPSTSSKKSNTKDKKQEKSSKDNFDAGFDADFGDDDEFGDFQHAKSESAPKPPADDPFANIGAPSASSGTSTPIQVPSAPDFDDPFADLSGAFSPQKPLASLSDSLSPPSAARDSSASPSAAGSELSFGDGDDNRVAELSLSFGAGGSGFATPSATSAAGDDAASKASSPKLDDGVFAWDDGDDDDQSATKDSGE